MTKTYFAPGRVNLIGEHLDYNGGLVLPAALTIGITATYTKRTDDKIVLRSATHPFQKEFDLNDPIQFDAANDWTNYPLGIINQLKKEGHFVSGCEILFNSNLPEGSGLSSSAAVEVLTGYVLLSQTEQNINLPWLANLCRQVENNFIGVKCGIMDQFAVAMGKHDHAILLNCSTLEHNYVHFELNNYRLLVLDTKKPRSLIHSKYNERKSECDEALRILQATSSIQHLADAPMSQLDLLKDPIIKKRARHVITESLRVKESIKALRFNDLSTFGRLMNASHASLKNDYEVTGKELDVLAEEAQLLKGCLGARMTGAGFGGCAIALVHHDSIAEFKHVLAFKYHAATGLNCEIYESQIGDGVGEKSARR
jgi:galactokinase